MTNKATSLPHKAILSYGVAANEKTDFYRSFLFQIQICKKFDTSILIPATETPLIYPYFFVKPETQGAGGFVKWIVILLSAYYL